MARSHSPLLAAVGGGLIVAAGFLLMGQAERPSRLPGLPPVGVTSYEIENQHFAVAWEQRGRALVPTAWGVMDKSVPLRSGGIAPELAFAADRVAMQADRFTDDPQTREHLVELAQQLMNAGNDDSRRRAFTELWEAVKSASSSHATCPTCSQERSDCKGNPPECFERYVACVLYDCR